MDNLLGDFLRAHRSRVRPEEAGLPGGGRRRVPGLRRDEVAVLAGVSTDYYIRLEQGRERRPSAEVLAALGRVLRLDAAESAHLRRLATPRRDPEQPERVGAGLLRLLDVWRDTPAIVQDRYGDVLAANPLAVAIHPGVARRSNLIRVMFLEPDARTLFPDWEDLARQSVAWLRADADPAGPRLAALVGELTARSPDFARMWSRQDVRLRSTGRKRFAHPVVGAFTVDYETMRVGGGEHTLTVYHTAPGSPDADALALLASHAVTPA
ncbi:helix-turn-helix domain-containing protein [Catenuloplanes japonicus]|uniref:helix-turn-helix domain-containing protein n=1 Tax=Catenuloplanes japonicus TaxID=33876 RepID=UPI000526D429|nr:helix-turn-helix transcriptional regulator [Catenuloplanes japonicus]